MSVYEIVEHQIRNYSSAAADFRAVLDKCDAEIPHSIWSRLSTYLQLEDDLNRMAERLSYILKRYPPSEQVKTIFFGLYEPADGPNAKTVDIFIEGFAADDTPQTHESLRAGTWYWPHKRYLCSKVTRELALSFKRRSAKGLPDDVSEFPFGICYAALFALEIVMTDPGLLSAGADRQIVVQRETETVRLGTVRKTSFLKEVHWVSL